MLCLPSSLAETLAEIRPGTLSLRVPLDGAAIQVGAEGAPQTATIVVIRTPSALLVRRTDGEPLQAQIVRHRPDCLPSRSVVFAEPVDRLTVRADGARRWWVPDCGHVCGREDLIQLLATIATFSVAKQRRICAGSGAPR